MQLSTFESILTDLLDCGYGDLFMLDDLYENLADEIYDGDRTDMLKRAIQNGDGLNGILYEFYSDISIGVLDKIDDLLSEETEYLEEIIQDALSGKVTKKRMEKAKKVISADADEMRYNISPWCNCQDTSFQNDLDQTIDFRGTIDSNAVDLITYWLEKEDV